MAFKQLDVTIWGKKKKVIMTEVKWKKKKKKQNMNVQTYHFCQLF